MMRAARRFGLAAWMALTAISGAPAAHAQQVAPPIIIIVDVQQILHDSLVAKSIQKQMDQHTERYTKEVSKQENELRQTQDELESQRSVLTRDAFNAKMRDFQRRYDALDHSVQMARQALQQAYNNAMTKVENTALKIISNIAAQRKANLVITKAAVLFEEPGLDITQEVIRRLDATLPHVTLAVPPDENLDAAPAGPAKK